MKYEKKSVSGSMKCKLIEIDVILANGERKVAALGSINIMITFIKVFEGI